MKYILQSFLDSQFEFTKETISQIILEINNAAFSFVYKDELCLFVQNHQKALLNFKTEAKHSIAADEILHFVESYFTDHLDPFLEMSVLSKDKMVLTFGDDLHLIQNIVKRLSPKLLEISYPLLPLSITSYLTVHKYRYFNIFYPALLRQIIQDEGTKDDNWTSFLIEANFNHLKFTNYLINKILKEVGEEDHKEAQMDILQEHHKKHSQANHGIQLSYEPSLPSANKQVIDWLDIEIKHSQHKLKRIVPNQSVIEFKKREKLQTSMSVSQLVCVFRTFKETGVITNSVIQDMLKVINESFETQHTNNISLKSLKNSYYDVDDATKEETKRILAAAIRNIR